MSVFMPGDRTPGSPSRYPTHVEPRLNEIYQWLKAGYTEYSIAEQLDIGYSTWMDYKNKYPDIQEVYTRAQLERNALIMNKMHEKASGHTVKVKKQVLTKMGEIETLESEIYTPPDVNAADLYLRNNSPGYIQPRQESSGSAVHVHLSIDDARKAVGELLRGREQLEELPVIEIERDPE